MDPRIDTYDIWIDNRAGCSMLTFTIGPITVQQNKDTGSDKLWLNFGQGLSVALSLEAVDVLLEQIRLAYAKLARERANETIRESNIR